LKVQQNTQTGGMMKDRKLGFIEIGKGKLGLEMQNAFEQASLSARDLQGVSSVNLKIEVYPPDPDDQNFGHVAYQIRIVEPPKKSPKFTTLLIDGVIVNDGANADAAAQYELTLEFPKNSTPFKPLSKSGE
jgi:hypothetical protein